MLIYNCKLLFPKRFHPAQSIETFDGPLTLLRSGSEHQGAFFLFFPEGRRPRRELVPSLMRKSDANECIESTLSNYRVQLALSTKKDGMILEIKILLVFKRTFKVLQHLMFRILLGKIGVFRRNAPIDTKRII